MLTPAQVGGARAQGVQTHAHPQQGGPHGAPGGRLPEVDRLQRLARLRRRRTASPPRSSGSRATNRDIAKAVEDRHDRPGPRRSGAQADARRARRHVTASARPCSTARSQHAREWIAGEVNRRLLQLVHRPVPRGRPDDPEPPQDDRALVRPRSRTRTATSTRFQSPGTRLWRKTLRDNNGNGTIEVGDGVDPNRNYPEHWNYDNEGSSSVQSSDTYRGPTAGLGARDAGDAAACSSGSTSSSRSTTTRSAAGSSTPRAGRSARRPRTTRSTTPSRATSTTRRSGAPRRVTPSIRASRPTSST